jgi:hypothetical protein
MTKEVLDILPVGPEDHGTWAPAIDKLVKTEYGKKIVKTVASKSYGKELWGEAAKNGCNKTLRVATKNVAKHAVFTIGVANDLRLTCQGDMPMGKLVKKTTANAVGYSAGLWATGIATVLVGSGPAGWILVATCSIAANMVAIGTVNLALDTVLG